MSKTISKKRIQDLAFHKDVKLNENLVEVTVTIRFITDLSLPDAQTLVLMQTDKIVPNKRVEGYVVSKITGLEDVRKRTKFKGNDRGGER